jgi:sulfofructose kinase
MNSANQPLQIIGLGMSTLDIIVRLEQMPTWDGGAALDDLALDGGGPVGTAMCAAAHLGVSTGILTALGNDNIAALKEGFLTKYGVDTTHCLTRPIPEPQVVLVCVNALTGERVFSPSPHAASHPLRPEEIDCDYMLQADYLHLDGFYLSAAIQAARWMRAAGKKVSLDAAKTSGNISAGMRELVGLSDVVICGAGFSSALTGIDNLYAAGRVILDLGPQVFVETLGEQGSVTVSKDCTFHQPAYPVEARDTTGAGDVFHGAYLVGLGMGWDLIRVAQFASAAAGIKCTRLGGRRGIPNYDEVIKYLADYQPDFSE